MRILSIGNFTTGWDGSICDEEHIAASLEQLGHEVFRLQRELMASDGLAAANDPVGEFDFILIAQWNGYAELLMTTLGANHFCPIVYWAFDYQADGQEWHERLVKRCDVYLSKPLSDAPKHNRWRWFSQDFGPNFLDRHPEEVEKDIDILFTGSAVPWGDRNELVASINANAPRPLTVHSVTAGQWKDLGIEQSNGPIMDHGLPELYARAKIVLSIDHTHTAGYWSDRNFQAMLTGAFVLFQHTPMSESVFGSGVAYFYDKNDCLEKIRHYLDNPAERNQIAQVGYQLAHARGKAVHRAHELLILVKSIV